MRVVDVRVERAFGPSDDLNDLYRDALEGARRQRGGEAFLDSLGIDATTLDIWLDEESVWVAQDDRLRGFGVCSRQVIMGLYVDPTHRRSGIGRSLASEIIRECSPVDAYALPGDRAMKSLYESFGWKARLLTMRAE